MPPDTHAHSTRLARRWLPPVVVDVLRPYARRFGGNHNGAATAQWEMLPEWPATGAYRGWDTADIPAFQRERWQAFLHTVNGTGPLGIVYETPHPTRFDLSAHNTVMAFGYVLGLAAREHSPLSILDWGGGMGQWFVIAKALFPDIELRYTVHDRAQFCRHGSELVPDVTFISDPTAALSSQYDLVVASGSLQYSERWEQDLDGLVRATTRYLYLTRIPLVRDRKSFIVMHRPYVHGYDSEFPHWVVQREELLGAVPLQTLSLVRELLIDEAVQLDVMSEPCCYSGFLFSRPQT